MSLTGFIKQPHVKEQFGEEFPNQGNQVSNTIQAEWQTQNHARIRTAFDYLLRFWLQRNVPNCHFQPLNAESSLELAEEQSPEYEGQIRTSINQAKTARDEYLETGTVTPTLIQSAIDLARIDNIFSREGKVPKNLGEYDDADIVDCIRLIEILDNSNELDGSVVHLNPTLGYGSWLIGGANPDLILDGTLVDVEVSDKPNFKPDYWRRLVAYLVIADIENILHEKGVYDQIGLGEFMTEPPSYEIKQFGVYFARYGELSTIPASAIYTANNYPDFRGWFIQAAFDEYESYNKDLKDSRKKAILKTLTEDDSEY